MDKQEEVIFNIKLDFDHLFEQYRYLQYSYSEIVKENEQLVKELNTLMHPVRFEKEEDNQLWQCSGCGYELVGIPEYDGESMSDKPKYCPQCGGEIIYIITVK